MKRMIPCLACFLLLVTLAPCLHAAQPAPTPQTDLLTQIFAPASSAAVATPAEPPAKAPADLFPPAPRLTDGCTYLECIQGCNDCPWGQTNYCISTADCFCGCR